MTTEERLDRVVANLDHLAGYVDKLAGVVSAQGQRIEGLITVAESQQATIDQLIKLAVEQRLSLANLERQWQAYINTLPRQ
jgi:hypothetical protein